MTTTKPQMKSLIAFLLALALAMGGFGLASCTASGSGVSGATGGKPSQESTTQSGGSSTSAGTTAGLPSSMSTDGDTIVKGSLAFGTTDGKTYTGSVIAEDLPEWDGSSNWVKVNGNKSEFSDLEKSLKFGTESYGSLDSLGRCTVALSVVGEETMPLDGEERGEIYMVHPTGWQKNSGWERCHLIAYCLSAENANEENLVTGTHFMNHDGMRIYENRVANYIDRTNNHVLYRATPIFAGDELVCRGVQVEAWSVEDKGKGIDFNVFFFNVQPGQTIDYATGKVTKGSNASGKATESKNTKADDGKANKSFTGDGYVINTGSWKFHRTTCPGLKDANPNNLRQTDMTRDEIIAEGYEPCRTCNP